MRRLLIPVTSGAGYPKDLSMYPRSGEKHGLYERLLYRVLAAGVTQIEQLTERLLDTAALLLTFR